MGSRIWGPLLCEENSWAKRNERFTSKQLNYHILANKIYNLNVTTNIRCYIHPHPHLPTHTHPRTPTHTLSRSASLFSAKTLRSLVLNLTDSFKMVTDLLSVTSSTGNTLHSKSMNKAVQLLAFEDETSPSSVTSIAYQVGMRSYLATPGCKLD